MEFNKICRLCLSQPQVSYSLLEKSGVSFLEALTSIKINEDDHLPKRACLKCWLNLKLAYRIQQNIIEADRKLRLFVFENEDEAEDEPENIESTLELTEPSIESLNETLDECNIKQEHFEIIHKREPSETDEVVEEGMETEDPEFSSIKVENLTESEVLIICQTDVNSKSMSNNKESTKEDSTPCHICGSSVDESELIDHLKTHYSSRLKCDECNTYCENIAAYRKHILSKHKDMQNYWMCKICSASFQYKPLYKIHIEKAHVNENASMKHAREPYEKFLAFEDYKYDCPYCKRKFKTEERSLIHIKTHNKKECPICHVKITPANFKVHVDSHNSQPVICHLCGVTYKNQTSLRSHIYYTHSTRKYVCKYCKKVFKKAYDLPLHIKKEHTGQRDHVCDICGKSFFTFHTLNTHTKMTHMKLRPFQCQYCKKRFSSKHSLTTHERQHTNVTPYTCEVCGEGFRQNVSLRAHKKSKHNIVEEKTCACKVCGKKFGSQWAVLSHMRIH